MKIFLTGGTGFLGSRLLPALRETGAEIIGLAVTESDASKLAKGGAAVCRGDLSQPEVLETAMAGCDVVVHAAALMDVWSHPERFELINVSGTRNVVDAARKAAVHRLIYVSAAAVVAGAGDVNGDESLPLQYPAHCAYAASKSRAESVVLAANQADFTTLAIRPPMIWGSGDEAALPRFKEMIDRGRFAWINGGQNLYSTCHVDNVAEAVVCAINRGRGGSAYFVTDGAPRSYREIINSQLVARYGMSGPDRSMPRWLAHVAAIAVEGMRGFTKADGVPPITRSLLSMMTYESVVHDQKARRELGYVGYTSVQAGLEEIAAAALHTDNPSRPAG
jgi:nucleoside-diphosphate-sugar epimerase